MKDVLISLHRGYGLGDAVKMSAVLRHVLKYRPEWWFDFQAEAGRHTVGRGIAANAFEYGKNPNPNKVYDAEVGICLYDRWVSWSDRPNTQVALALQHSFDLPWDPECGQYLIKVHPSVEREAMSAMDKFICWRNGRDRSIKPVAVHYRGDSSPDKKNLSHEQADEICSHLIELGRIPLVVDWRNVSPLPNRIDVCTTGREFFSRDWGRDAERNCAVIRECAAFVGIDSGPAKCASATDVPSLVVWTGHHPAQFHDPAPNTTHLVPRGYHDLAPVCGDPGVVDWFEAHYNVRQYDRNPVAEVCRWLGEVLS